MPKNGRGLTRRRGPGKPFKSPHRGPGRPKGRKNNRTLVREFLLDKGATLELLAKGSKKLKLHSRLDRLVWLLEHASEPVAAALERELMLHEWGRPKETLTITGKLDVTTAIGEAFRKAREDDGGEEPKT